MEGGREMATVERGAVMTCGHQGCGCQIRIDGVCACAGVTDESSYACICGAPLVAKLEVVPVAGGEVLTCGHPGCDCAVRVEAPCACRGSEGGHYTCICGAQLVAKVP